MDVQVQETINIIDRIAKARNMDLVVRIENDDKLQQMILFGSIKLIYNPAKARYSLFRLQQVSINEDAWVRPSSYIRSNLLSLLRFYYIKGQKPHGWLEDFYDKVCSLLFKDLQKLNLMGLSIDIENIISRRFKGGIWSLGWVQADKAIRKFLRETICKDTMLMYRKMYPGLSFAFISVAGYSGFSRKYTHITGDCGSLYPLIPSLYDGSECDGSNDWFAERLKGKLSRGDIKLMRKAPISLMRYCEGDELELLLLFLRHPHIKRYPVPILKDIQQRFHDSIYQYGIMLSPAMKDILNKWLYYHRDIWKQHGFKQYRDEWFQFSWQLFHAFDWAMDEQPEVKKNQDWLSILRLSRNWAPRRKCHSNLEWEPLINGDDINMNGVVFTELTSGQDLFDEGEAMHHCVYTYTSRCHANKYRVFRVESESERATAGLLVKPDAFQLDQLFTYCNGTVSAELLRSTKQFAATLTHPK